MVTTGTENVKLYVRDGAEHAPMPTLPTEPVSMRDLRSGDTVIDENLWGRTAYRVVQTSGPFGGKMQLPHGESADMWTVTFDRDRDVPGPGESFLPTFTAAGRTALPDAPFRRVTDLGDWEMCQVYRLRELDILADDRTVWDVARHVTSDRNVLVRFEREDDFTPFPLGAVLRVQGRRVNKHARRG